MQNGTEIDVDIVGWLVVLFWFIYVFGIIVITPEIDMEY